MSFHTESFSRQQDSNSDCQSKKQEHRPLDQHHGSFLGESFIESLSVSRNFEGSANIRNFYHSFAIDTISRKNVLHSNHHQFEGVCVSKSLRERLVVVVAPVLPLIRFFIEIELRIF